MDLSRRTVLGTIAAGAVVVGLSEPAQASAAPPRRGLGVKVLQSVTLRTFDPTWVRETTLEVPLVLELAGYAAASDQLQMTVTYDARLLDVEGDVVLTAAGAAWRVTPEVDAPDATGLADLRFSVARPGGRARTRESTVVSLPLRRRELYPAENLGAPLAFGITVARPQTSERRVYRWQAPAATTEVTPWGAVVAAGWARTSLGYRLPSAVRLQSVGPLPVPAGAVLTVEVDARLASACVVTAATLVPPLVAAPPEPSAETPVVQPPDVQVDVTQLRAESQQAGEVLRTTFTVPEVPAGSALQLTLECTPTGAEVGRAVRFASVALAGTGAPAERLRSTGAYSTADLTASGTPEGDDVAVGTV